MLCVIQNFSQPGRFAGLEEDEGNKEDEEMAQQQPGAKEVKKEEALADVTNES